MNARVAHLTEGASPQDLRNGGSISGRRGRPCDIHLIFWGIN